MLSQTLAAYWKQGAGPMDSEPDVPSLLYKALPTLIQRRVPKIRSLRRTASAYRKAKKEARRIDSACSDVSRTPPPSYHTSARTSIVVAEDEEAEAFRPLPRSRLSSSGGAASALASETDSGVQWKYARQGLSLLSLAAQEECLLSQDVHFSRKLYLDSLGYLLQGLPSELTADEETSLRMELPPSLRPATPVSVEADGQISARPTQSAEPSAPTVLHQTVATVTVQLFVIAAFILPHVQLLLQQAYAYDRKHKISDRVLAQSWIVVDTVSKHAITAANAFREMHNRKVGTAVKDIAMRWVQGVGGGLCEGVAEGVQVLRLREAAQSSTNRRPRLQEEFDG